MDLNKINQIKDATAELVASYKKLAGVVSNGPLSYYLDKIEEYYIGCINASKFKVGDRVALKGTPHIKDSSGLYWCKHFLIDGATATVKSIDYSVKRSYVYDLEFDNETRINSNGHKCTPTNKHTFNFNESEIQSIDYVKKPSEQQMYNNGYVETIAVEKLLCKKLGIEWQPSGISIENLIDNIPSDSTSITAKVELNDRGEIILKSTNLPHHLINTLVEQYTDKLDNAKESNNSHGTFVLSTK